MREEKLLDLIGQIDSRYINEAVETPMIRKGNWLRWSAVAAGLMLCIIGVLTAHGAYREYHTEVSYVCLDVNPSFELCLNHKDQVVNTIAYNDDGKKLLEKIDFHGRHYEEVICDILQHDDFQKYLTDDFTVTVVSENTSIQESIRNHMNAANCDGKVVCADPQTRDMAYSNHCSVGKYVAYEELAQYDRNVTLESCKEMTMHEIYEEIERHHSSHHDQQGKPNDQGQTVPDDHCDDSSFSNHHSEHH